MSNKRKQIRDLEAEIAKLKAMKRDLKASKQPDVEPTQENVEAAVGEYLDLRDEMNEIKDQLDAHKRLIHAWLDERGQEFDELAGHVVKRSTFKRKHYLDDELMKRLGDAYDDCVEYREGKRLSVKADV